MITPYGTITQGDIWSINHLKPGEGTGRTGGIAREFVVGAGHPSPLRSDYCDMVAPYTVWKHYEPKDLIGFHGYRKHINFRDPLIPYAGQLALGWETVPLTVFQNYQEWLCRQSITLFKEFMADTDVLCVEPFNCSYNEGMANDYCVSRSPDDWRALEKVMTDHGDFYFDVPYIRPMHFVCRYRVFHRYMKFWDSVRKDLEPLVLSKDAVTPDYPKRAMAFLSERIWSLWLDSAGLRIETFPLIMCWEAR
jgi:Domain of unknown function (DUF4422)